MAERVQKITELVIDASGVEAGMRRAEIAYEHLGDRAAAATAKATASFERQQQIFSSKLPQSIDRVADAFDNLRAKGDPVVTAQIRLEREMTRSLDVINRAVLTGVATEEQATAELSRIRTRQIAELDGVRLAHDAVAAAAKRQAAEYAQLAAAARQSQVADRTQTAFNSQLGIVAPQTGDARASASVFEEQFREMEAAARRAEEISMLRSQQSGANFAQDLNGRFGIGQQAISARASASAFEEAAREADDLAAKVASLRAEINPTQAAQDRLNAELEQYSLLAERAGLSAKELAQAQALARARFDASVPGQGGANDNSGQSRRQNLIYQGFDIGQGFAGGMPVGMIAAQQLPQIAQNYVGQGGLRAAASDIATLATGALAAIGPVGIAFGVAGSAALAYYALNKRETKTTEDLLKEHQESIRSVGALWGDAAEQRSRYGRSSTDTVTLGLDNSITALTKRLRENVESGDVGAGISSAINLNRDATGLNGRQFRESSFFKVLQLDFDALHKATVAGKPDILGLIGRLQDIRRTSNNSGIREMADDAIAALKPFRDLAEALRDVEMDRRRLFDDRGPNGRLLSRGTTNSADAGNLSLFEARERIAQERSQAALDAQIASLNARSPQQKADAARQAAAAQYNDNETAAARRLRIQQEGTLALAQAEKTLADAREARSVRLSRIVTDQQLEIQLVGKTAGEAATLRREYELLNQLKDEARQNGGIVDPDEVARIRGAASQVGRLTEELSRARLQQDARFEREQLFRTNQEAGIASQLRGSGLPVDLASQDAAMLRSLEILRENKAAWEDIRDVGRSAIDDIVDGMSNGFENGWDIVKNIFTDINKEMLNLAVANPLKNALYGDNLPTMQSVGGLGGIFSALTGGKFPGADAAGKAVGAMSVTAGSVVVNGGGIADPANVSRMFAPANSNDPFQAIMRPAGGNISAYARAIQSIESGGRYDALGPITRNGDRAYGAYQVMGNNVGPWSEAALGRRLTANQFLSDRGAQDAIFNHRFGGYVDKYGPSGAAQAWFGGPGSVGKGGGSADILGTTGTAYVNKFNSALDRVTTSALSANQGLGTFGGGLNQIGSALSQFPAAPQGGGGGGGGLFGWLGSLLSGPFVPNGAQATFAAGGGIGLWSDGGFTGYGGKNDPAGIVHRGEVVWSQADIARIGGVAAADAIRRGGIAPISRPVATGGGSIRQTVNRQINIINAPPGYYPEVQEEEDDEGNEKVNVTFSKMAANEARRPGSPLNKQLKSMGARQPRVRR
ncbi:hypothetical protein [Rhizobium sp. Leaf386]|uniref:hypothetical protein n=1 Tax=Rhizobium sp. Leaf386 TaxID=1736359 RepID=UPI0007145AFF|nr:hypothetical protein [Rhizobium sp. Leaf386]KQS84120.1 hypothetical protein ASG50_29975 [Rhizobium sp. Leaf386]